MSIEALSGIALLAAALAAIVWANAGGYERWWSRDLGRGAASASPRGVVDDGLMVLFFFLVGLEIKRELVAGELRDRRAAALPAMAALGGIALPALVFGVVASGSRGLHGWTIPLATDVAFSLGVLALLGGRVPRAARLFLLELAIVDDLGTLLIVALLYAGGAVSATLIGVAVAFLVPERPIRGRRVLEYVEHGLLPWVSFGVVPLFVLANAGVLIDGPRLDAAFGSRVTLGVLAALVIGKVVGIVGMTALGLRLGIGRLPAGLGLRHIVGLAMLGAISFTVSLFVADVAFAGAALDHAKLGLFAASIAGGALGALWLGATARRDASRPGSDA